MHSSAIETEGNDEVHTVPSQICDSSNLHFLGLVVARGLEPPVIESRGPHCKMAAARELQLGQKGTYARAPSGTYTCITLLPLFNSVCHPTPQSTLVMFLALTHHSFADHSLNPATNFIANKRSEIQQRTR